MSMALQEQLENVKISQKNFFLTLFLKCRDSLSLSRRTLKIEETLKVKIVAWYMEIPNTFCVTKKLCCFETYKKSGLGNLKASA